MRPLRIVILVAALIALLLIVQGTLGLAAPTIFVQVIHFFQTPPVIYLAAALRIAIGVILICAAPGSRLPTFSAPSESSF